MRSRWVRIAAALLGCALLAAAPKAAPKPAWPHGDPDAVIKRVLAQPAYRSERTTAVAAKQTLLEQILAWIKDKLGGVARAFLRALHGAQTASAAFGIGLIIAMLALLIFLIARIVRFFAFGRGVPDQSVHGVASIAERGSSEWLGIARARAERADYAAAIAALFNAALRRLDERGIVPFDGSRSPGEYRALVRRALAPIAGAFDTLARRFLIASFSRDASGPADYEETLRAYGALEAGTP